MSYPAVEGAPHARKRPRWSDSRGGGSFGATSLRRTTMTRSTARLLGLISVRRARTSRAMRRGFGLVSASCGIIIITMTFAL